MRPIRFATFFYRWHIILPCLLMGAVTLGFYLLVLAENFRYPDYFVAALFFCNVLMLVVPTLVVRSGKMSAKGVLKINTLVLGMLLLINPAVAISLAPELKSVLWALASAAYMLWCGVYLEEPWKCRVAAVFPFLASLAHVVLRAAREGGAKGWEADILFGFLMSIFFAMFGAFLRALSTVKELPGLGRDAKNAAKACLASFGLSPRELDVCLAILDGLTAKETGEQLYISEGTVKNHLKKAYKKLQIRTKLQLVQLLHDKTR